MFYKKWKTQYCPFILDQTYLDYICLLVHNNDCSCAKTSLLGHQVVKVHQNFVANLCEADVK